jgi:tetratricopeptide (TPR) repeat protein
MQAFQQGDYDTSAAAFRRATELFESLVKKPGGGARYQSDVARGRARLGQSLTRAQQYEPARQELRQALELGETLYKASGAYDSVAIVASAMFALCDLERRAGTAASALEWFVSRGRDAEPLTRQDPPAAGAWLVLRDAVWGQAEMLGALGRLPEALAAWDRAIALDDDDERKRTLRLLMLTALARTDDYANVAVINETLEGQARHSGTMLYPLARAFALAAKSAEADARLTPEDRARRIDEYTARAVNLLQVAQGLGYFADRAARDDIATDRDLDSLRTRPAFQKLLADLKATPPAGGSE